MLRLCAASSRQLIARLHPPPKEQVVVNEVSVTTERAALELLRPLDFIKLDEQLVKPALQGLDCHLHAPSISASISSPSSVIKSQKHVGNAKYQAQMRSQEGARPSPQRSAAVVNAQLIHQRRRIPPVRRDAEAVAKHQPLGGPPDMIAQTLAAPRLWENCACGLGSSHT